MSAPVLDPAPHEFGGNLIFTEHELSPYFALDRRVKDGGGSASATVRHEGEVFDATLSYQRSGLKPRDDPDFCLETVREFRIRLEARDDVGERKASYHVAPRWPNMESKGDAPNPSTPKIVGVNVRCDGSNLLLDAYPVLLRKAAGALDVNSAYFEEPHRHSNIFAFERYARVRRSKSGKVVGMNSPMQRIFEHVAGEGKFRELREDDRNCVEGYHHRVKIDSDGAAVLVPGHELGKKLKHYHPEHPRSDPSDPLYHPKVGVSLQSNLNGGSVKWSDRDALRRELDETLVNLLSWAGLPTRADPSVYVADAYFQVRESARPLTLIDDPTPEIRREQNALVCSLPVDPDLNPSDRDVLEAVADGGKPVNAVGDETGWSKRTVYRVLDRLDGLLSLRDGTVRFASEYLGDVVRSALSDTLDALRQDTDGESEGSAFAEWKRRYGVEVEDPSDARLQLRFGRVPGDVTNALRDGFRAWLTSGRDPRRFKTGRARWQDSEGRSNYRVPALG
ncbi:helix-turn-helix transcriptional regulator [Halococcus agarilyticus]|uniref:helix-turn-helix transcriptional regulator n=1 Tax=Halococcus agarilyticus TaxID=1232219 RepID=UPI0012AB88B5|nr:hypothetical protein [Halococcus agarilyticus]